MNRLLGKVSIVTGGAMGIGAAVAARISDEGGKVLIADINEEAATGTIARLRNSGADVALCGADVTSDRDWARMVDEAIRRWGRLDIVVNNAVMMPPEVMNGVTTAVEMDEQTWDRMMAVTAKAVFLSAKHVVPVMSGGGLIINMSSVHGLLQSPGWLWYDVAKTALLGMTRQMACDLGPKGIRVNAICPGMIVTERTAEVLAANEPVKQFLEQQYPLRRLGKPEDVAKAVVFLTSDDSAFITGHSLVVDGGLTLQLQEDFAVRMGHYAQQSRGLKLSTSFLAWAAEAMAAMGGK